MERCSTSVHLLQILPGDLLTLVNASFYFVNGAEYLQGGFFTWSALKMTKCKTLRNSDTLLKGFTM